MKTGRPLKELTLSDDERLKLEQWARRPKSAQRLAFAFAHRFGLRFRAGEHASGSTTAGHDADCR